MCCGMIGVMAFDRRTSCRVGQLQRRHLHKYFRDL